MFSSGNYSDDFEGEEDTDAPLTKAQEETNTEENPKSEKLHVPKQVYINYIFDSFETSVITLADCHYMKSSKYGVLHCLAHCCEVISLLTLRHFLNSGCQFNVNLKYGNWFSKGSFWQATSLSFRN